MTSDGQYYPRVRFKQIITEQVALSYLTQGGVPYSDSDTMTPYERKLALDAIQEMLEHKAEAESNKIKEMQLARQNQAPKSRLTK